MEGFCKGCLIKCDDPSQLLQYTEKNRRLYVYSTGLQVKRNDPIPFQLCKECFINMKQSCKFKKQCRTSDKHFKNYLALKETGDTTDFCTYLKINDDSLMLQFPMVNKTPSHKANDCDNESTCTSIRNFMSDILQADEIPDTEARIIKEVIEEEADVLDDSLDSHWLQDNVSIDTDFHLDFNFSPFSTPRSGHSECFQTPRSLNREPFQTPQKENNQCQKAVFDQESFIAAKKILLSSTPSSDKQISADNENIPVTITEENLENIHTENLETQDTAEFSEENNQIDNAGKQIEINEIEDNKDNIDLNLEKALKNTDNTQFSLDDLLVTPKSDARLATPPLQPGTSGFSTPTIPNIIYDITVDVTPFEENSNSPQAEHGIENVEGSESGILDDFFNKDTGEYIGDITKNQEKEIFEDFQAQDTVPLENSDKSKYDLSNLSCLLCTKKYNTLKALKIHFAKLHKFKILGSRKIVTDVICDHCGKTYRQLNSLKEHIKVKHYNENTKLFEKIKSKDSYNYKCKLCSLAYISRRTLSKHMTTHTGKRVLNTGNKKFVCDVCSFACSNVSNLKTHIRRRHTKEYLHHCSECGRGFYRKTELDTHMRSHNGDRPYLCIYCAKSFSRCDSLNTHMKQHTNERRFVCTFCESSFVSASYLNWHLKSSKTCRRLRLGEYFIDGAGENYLKWTVSVPDYNQRKHGKQLTPVAEDIEMTDLLDMDREGPLDCDSADLPDIAEDGTVNRAVNVASEGLPTDIDSLEI